MRFVLTAVVPTPTPNHVRTALFRHGRIVLVQSHRTMSRVKSASSFRMVFCFLAISVGFAASALPFWDMWAVTGTSFQPTAQTLVRKLGKRGRHYVYQRGSLNCVISGSTLNMIGPKRTPLTTYDLVLQGSVEARARSGIIARHACDAVIFFLCRIIPCFVVVSMFRTLLYTCTYLRIFVRHQLFMQQTGAGFRGQCFRL